MTKPIERCFLKKNLLYKELFDTGKEICKQQFYIHIKKLYPKLIFMDWGISNINYLLPASSVLSDLDVID